MKFMILLKATSVTEAGEMPDTDLLATMTAYNEELLNAGVLAGGEGLHLIRAGARVRFDGLDRHVGPGPFGNDPASLIAGFWIFETRNLEEAVEWVKRYPNPTGQQAEIEIRRILSPEDFGTALTEDLRRREEKMQLQIHGHLG
jgi:hypothetical protein